MISLEDVASAMPAAESLLPRLQGMYQALPETICTCDQPGVCCHSLPEITALEAVSMIRLMQGMGDGELTATARRFAELFLTDPARQTTCPFLREGACTIYVHRPFACRAYGLWSQDLGAIKTQESREARRALGQLWKKHGVELSPELAERELDYCDKVEVVSGKPLSHSALMALLQRVYALGAPLGSLQTRFEQEYHSDFSFLLTSISLGARKAMLFKLAVIKETTDRGTDTHLKSALDKISACSFRIAGP